MIFGEFWTIWGHFWDSPGVIFRSFFDIFFWSRFCIIFFEKMQRIQNWKYSSGPVNYSVLWRSPDLKMYSQLCKSASFFHCFSYAKTSQNRLKNLIKRWVQQKSMKIRSLGLLFGPRGDFGLFWGSQGVPKIDQKSTPSFQIKAQLAGGMSQEAPRTNFNRFLMILEWFLGPQMVNFGTIWGAFWRQTIT